MFVTLRGQLDSLPTNMEYVVCGQAAAKFLGLTTVKPSLHIYTVGDYLPISDPTTSFVKLDSFDRLETIKLRGDVLCTSVAQTIIDLLKDDKLCNRQVIPESIAMIIARSENGEIDMDAIEDFIRENGLEAKYQKYKEAAYDFMERWG